MATPLKGQVPLWRRTASASVWLCIALMTYHRLRRCAALSMRVLGHANREALSRWSASARVRLHSDLGCLSL